MYYWYVTIILVNLIEFMIFYGIIKKWPIIALFEIIKIVWY